MKRDYSNVYSARVGKESVIVKVYKKEGTETDQNTLKQIQSKVPWLNFLEENGVNVSTYISPCIVEGPNMFVTVATRLSGAQMKMRDVKNHTKVFEIGRFLRSFHEASMRFDQANPGADIEVNVFDGRLKPIADAFRSYERCEEPTAGNFGICHGDFHDLNFFFGTDGRLGCFDFDTSERQFYLYDLACCLMSIYFQLELG